MIPGRCSECGKPLVNADGSPKPSGTKTCSSKCRSKRTRRLKREKSERNTRNGSLPEGAREVSQVVTRGKVKDAAHEVMKEELRPVVREQMTEQVLSGINNMMALTPRAIELLTKQMESQDETVSQRAATLILKYTLGNPSVAPPSVDKQGTELNVTFNVPRPGDDVSPGDPAGVLAVTNEAQPVDAVEMRTCQDCREEKPAHEFVGASERCQVCHAGMTQMLVERFGEAYGSSS